jgi:hypothetical protein
MVFVVVADRDVVRIQHLRRDRRTAYGVCLLQRTAIDGPQPP